MTGPPGGPRSFDRCPEIVVIQHLMLAAVQASRWPTRFTFAAYDVSDAGRSAGSAGQF